MTDAEWNDLFKKVNQIHQGLYGVPGSEDMGMVGDFKEFKIAYQNHCKENDKTRTILYWLIGVLSSTGVLTGAGFGIAQLIS